VACDINLVKCEGHRQSRHVHWKSGNISETVVDHFLLVVCLFNISVIKML